MEFLTFYSPAILMLITAIFSRRRTVLITVAIVALLVSFGFYQFMLFFSAWGRATSPGDRSGIEMANVYFNTSAAAWLAYLFYLPYGWKRSKVFWEKRRESIREKEIQQERDMFW